ncbi:1-aminocyclopropane-1-carboxylate deaminase [Marivirga tractuosa]|uniref:1-aminocyclopropane-1-carboxylate deaminase n=1 Tax=Marivirga tractuosa (strain ATCC 23168 / DSM 4126 / NBRC 15989 / NCIMB 1408 / VKM B-1430 / H-43) TaxID=643867 RepID=E4TV24_MARTH|nr:pyridoxal-phosphate dependent enzyme [Marivirga tractuosa]ADR22117.1 1-aminocyclopropane-1-carboxylate deaminase [Marivirga tractuosa DSM 4126]BDD13421.1 1-aminocyclopropane-1-carboxylate deaminase [Marivirga tractuosa]
MSVKKFFTPDHVPIQRVQFAGLIFDILRLDKIHEGASGNKFFKLKYNFLEAEKKGFKKILTFGGAFSNHIAATAISAKACGFQSIGIIRGEKVNNPTLELAIKNGMQLHFIDREDYRNKDQKDFLNDLKNKYDNPFIIPEGGTNEKAIAGTSEIHEFIPDHYNLITACFGTGGTLAGLINAKASHQKILGFSVLKGDWVKDELRNLVDQEKENWELSILYHFGGYAKWKQELIDFIIEFYEKTAVPLDPVYTGKMMFGLMMEWKKDNISSDDHILAVHSGGLQGIEGFNKRFGFDLVNK